MLHPIYRKRKDLKVNLLKYIDPVGLILFVFTSVGWQKPGEYNPIQFKDKEKGFFFLMLVGMAANILLILALIPIFMNLYGTTRTVVGSYGITFVFRLIQYSFALIIVNLLPVPPLDMAKMIYSINPNFYFKMIQNERIIHAVFILLIAFNILNAFVMSLFTPIQQFLI
jgi:Zn-dependent protease